MKKNKNIIAIIFLLVIITCFFSSQKVFAADDEGFFITANVVESSEKNYPQCCPSYWTCGGVAGTGNIFTCLTAVGGGIFDTMNFSNLDLLETEETYFGDYRMNATIPHKYANIMTHGQKIYIPTTGNYSFNIEKPVGSSSSGIDIYLNITKEGTVYEFRGYRAQGNQNLYCSALGGININLTGGNYYWLDFSANIYSGTGTPINLALKWKKPGDTVYTLIPKENMRWKENFSKDIIIPETINPEEKINFYTTGVGIKEYLDGDGVDDGDPKINLEIPVERIADDFSGMDAYVFWSDKIITDLTPEITIENTSISKEQTIEGEKITKPPYTSWSSYAKVPAELIGFDAERKMNFVFKGMTSTKNTYGIGMVIPYKDNAESAKATRLYLKLIGDDPYKSTHPPVTFDLDDDIDKTNIKPIFFFGDGDTRTGASYRPNYMSMLSGTGSRPNKGNWLEKMSGSKRIYPKPTSGNYDINNPNTWNPVFGREGSSFDVLSVVENYLPNKLNSYIGQEAIINQIDAEGKDWISFQLYSSNFSEDVTAGGPESTEILAIGLLGGEKNKKLKVCPNTPSDINVGQTVDYEAYFWADYNGAGDYCVGPIANGATEVTDLGDWKTSDAGIVKTTATKGSFEAVSDGLAQIWITYDDSLDVLRSNDVDVKVLTPLQTCPHNICDATTGYVCKKVMSVADSCSAFTNDCDDSIPETCEIEKWREVTP